jgi:ATP-dependent helicase HrpA
MAVLRASPAKDVAGLATISRVEDAYAELCAALPDGPLPPDVEEIGWMLEELRVGLFAQQLRTKFPVSEKRVLSTIADTRRRHGLT